MTFGGSTVASMGPQIQVGYATESSFGVTPATITNGIVPASESLAKRSVILWREGLRGTRSQYSTDARAGTYAIAGTLELQPTPDDLTLWLYYILGATAVDTGVYTITLAESLPSFSVVVDRIAKVHTYAGCVVDRATFRATKGGLMSLSLDICGQSETIGDSGSFPSLTTAAYMTKGPYQMGGDSVFTLNGEGRETEEFTLVIDNMLVKDRYMNSLTVTGLPSMGREISLQTRHAWAAPNTDLYDQAVAGATGSLAMTNDDSSTTFTFGILQVPPESPVTQGRNEIMLGLNMMARKTGSTLELAISHTP